MDYKVEIINHQNTTSHFHDYSFINSKEMNKTKQETTEIHINAEQNITTKKAKLISPTKEMSLSQRHDFSPKTFNSEDDNDLDIDDSEDDNNHDDHGNGVNILTFSGGGQGSVSSSLIT